MRNHHVDNFLQQTQIAAHISLREIGKRLATAVLLTTICWMAGFGTTAIMAMLIIVGYEVGAFVANKKATRHGYLLTPALAVVIWLINWTSFAPFLSFSIILSHSTSLPFIIVGYIWLFGLYVHVSNTYGLLPIYVWSLMPVAYGASFLMIWHLSHHPGNGGSTVQWMMSGAIMIVYIVNTVDTITLQKDTHGALASAREEANTRLAELERLSRHDSLTGLMNRRAFDETLQKFMRRSRDRSGLTVFLIDLDGFKPINDSYSHNAGDAVLCEIAQRLRQLAGPHGRVARLGGDEFAVVTSKVRTAESAVEFGENIAAAIAGPVAYEQKMLTVGASVGIAQQGADAETPAALLSAADQAMYHAKHDADRRVALFNKNSFPVRPTLEDRKMLLLAMAEKQIMPHYQPKVCITSDRVIGFEALSRWDHPTRGLLQPGDFLPMINELGLQGEFLMHTATHVLRDIDTLVSSGLEPGQISINVPEVTLATITGRTELFTLIDRYPHLRQHLTFEITEDIFIARSGDIIQSSIKKFSEAGVRISLDDFGTGFASFQHLRELEFDELKLDTGFVQGLGVDPAANVLVDGFLTIGKGLGVTVVAEGVESAEQLAILRKMGCEVVQGHFFGAAIPFAAVQQRLKTDGTHIKTNAA